MVIKLLTKSDIDKAKAADRKQEIDEGVKLAKRVDALREIQSQEEASLAKFRSETLSKLQADIDEKQKEKDDLSRDIEAARNEHARLMKPLDDEWKKAHERQADLDARKARIDEKETEISEKQTKLKELETALKADEMRIVDAKLETRRLLLQAAKRVENALKLEKDAQQTMQRTLDKVDDIHTEQIQREAEIAVREREVSLKQDHLSTTEKELEKRLVAIIDREETYKRNLIRLENKYGRERI